MSIQIVLKPFFTPPALGADLQSARLRIEVVSAEGITPDIFLHERYTLLKDGGLVSENRFIAVAKPGDLTVYPATEPATSQEPPFYRLSCLDLVFNSPTLLDEGYESIVEDVTQLVQTMKRLENLEEQDVVVIGG